MKSIPLKRRRGYTIVEVSIALIAAGTLAIGLSSALFVSFQAAGSEATPAPGLLRGSEFLIDMQLDLQYAVDITKQVPKAITVAVSDRTGDSVDDTIHYSWSENPGDPLVRQFNGGTSESVLDDVHEFGIDYKIDDDDVLFVTVEIQVGPLSDAILQSSFPMYNKP